MGCFNVFFPGGYQTSWSILGIFLDQQEFGWVEVGMSCLQFCAIVHGGIGFRKLVSYLGLFLSIGVWVMMWSANHQSVMQPYLLAFAGFRVYIIGRLAKIEARRGPSS